MRTLTNFLSHQSFNSPFSTQNKHTEQIEQPTRHEIRYHTQIRSRCTRPPNPAESAPVGQNPPHMTDLYKSDIYTNMTEAYYYNLCGKQIEMIEELKKTNLLLFEAKEKRAQTINERDVMISNLLNANDMLSQEKQELKDANDELEFCILDLEQQMLDRQYYEQHPPPPHNPKSVYLQER